MQATSSPRVNATQSKISILDTAKENAQEHGTKALINTTKENLEKQMENYFKIISIFELRQPNGKIELTDEDIVYIDTIFDPTDGMIYLDIPDSTYQETKNSIYKETALSLDKFRSKKNYNELFDGMLNHFESEGWIIARAKGKYTFSKKGTNLAQNLDNYFREQAKDVFKGAIQDHLMEIENNFEDLSTRLEESQIEQKPFSPMENDNAFIQDHIRKVSSNNPRNPKEEHEVLFTKISRDLLKGVFGMLDEVSPWNRIPELRDRYTGGDYMHSIIEEIADEIANDEDVFWIKTGTEGIPNNAGLYEKYNFQKKTATEKRITLVQKLFGRLLKNPF